MNAAKSLVALLWIAFSASWTPCPAQSDSTVVVTIERLRSWAANRSVSDELLKGKAVDLAKAVNVLVELRDANNKCIDVLRDQREENERLRAALRASLDDQHAATAKVQRLRPWSAIGKVTIYGGLVVGGLFIANSLVP